MYGDKLYLQVLKLHIHYNKINGLMGYIIINKLVMFNKIIITCMLYSRINYSWYINIK